jgi:predicted porin
MMNKAPLMVMTALALAAGSVAAQSTLQIYGTLDVSVANTKTESTAWALGAAAKASTTAVSSGTMTGSYIGFKGTEDLGGGMEASFVLESPLSLDTGAQTAGTALLSAPSRLSLGNPAATWNVRDEGSFWAKNAYVGLKTNFGLIRIGQMETLGYISGVKWNPFGEAAINPTTRVFYSTDYYARSWSNAIAYYLRVDGLIVAVQHAPKNDSTTGAGGAKTTAALSYTAGPFSGSIGYETNKDNVALSTTSPVGAAPAEAKSWALHGSYDFGVAKLFAEYGSGKLDRVTAGQQDVKSKGYQLGASVPVGNGAFLASFAKGEQKADNTASFTGGTKFRDVKVLSVGYDHNLSKRTDAYVVYSSEKDKYPAVGAAAAFLNNLSIESKTLAVGIRHRF